MKRLSFVGSTLLAFACSTSPQKAAAPDAPLAVAVDARPGATSGAIVAADAPAHVFTPRARSPRPSMASQPVDMNALPRLRTSQCFFEQPAESSTKGAGGGALAPLGNSGSGYAGGVPARAAKPRSAAPKAAASVSPPAAEAKRRILLSEPSTRTAAPAAPPPAPVGRQEIAEEGRGLAPDRETPPADSSAPREYHDYGASIYLSNDDTMSLSSAQRVIYAIDRFLPLPGEHIRPHELLNYFSFETAPVAPSHDFSVRAAIEPKPGKPGEFTLGLSVSGRSFSKEERRNAALTFVVDRSGSMEAEGRMEYLKRGLQRMTSELKRGDLVNLVLFDDQVCTPVENFVVGRDPMKTLTRAIDALAPRGSTDVYSGLRVGYALADKAYQATHTNRVLLITDALANTGVTDPAMMSMIASHYDARRIRLSGIGVGAEFNDGLLDRLTERGKGAYVFLGSPSEVDAVFGERFVSLIETTANDVHFKLQLPPSLRMNVFYGEESSTVKADVQAIHYFAGTSQLFLSDLMARTPALRTQDSLMLSVEYEHPETGQKQVEDFAFNLGEISRDSRMVKKGRLIMSFIDGLADTVQSSPERTDYRAGGWVDPSASQQCARGRASLEEQARSLDQDAEVVRVVNLWDKYCARYEAVRSPVRRTAPQGSDVWPSAQR